ncbi:polyphenol oxidase family protein [Trueperella sp. LYQ141]|uniref:polyphenol oxidase family protein n=1 Tax=Trueperella sp. LYQ141 TaxID=3391058 RepID=UPI0039832948
MTHIEWLSSACSPVGVRIGVTNRHAGFSVGDYASANLGFHVGDDPEAVRANRDSLTALVGCDITWMSQVHGTHIASADEAEWGPLGYLSVGQADAIIVAPGQAGAVMVADCVPLVIADTQGRYAAVVHAGRRGFEQGIAQRVVQALRDRGVAELEAYIGPAICGKCYELPDQMAHELWRQFPHTRAITAQGSAGIDIRSGLVAQLRQCQVSRIRTSSVCTYESTDYFSHRRATHQGQATGRFAVIAALS